MVPGEAARGVVTNAMPNNATGLISLRCSQGTLAFALGAPHQRTFVTFDRKQIAHHFGGSLLTVAVRQSGSIIRFGVNLCVELGDQRILERPRDESHRVWHFREPN